MSLVSSSSCEHGRLEHRLPQVSERSAYRAIDAYKNVDAGTFAPWADIPKGARRSRQGRAGRAGAGRQARGCRGAAQGNVAALILAENVERRSLSVGQRAMLVPEGKAGRLKEGEKSPTELGISGEMIRRARHVLRFEEALARSVLNGAVSLNEAYETAGETGDEQAKKEAAETGKVPVSPPTWPYCPASPRVSCPSWPSTRDANGLRALRSRRWLQYRAALPSDLRRSHCGSSASASSLPTSVSVSISSMAARDFRSR